MLTEQRQSPRMAVVQAIRKWIADGELPSGAALPSERALSERLHVQRPTVRRGLRILEEQGFVQTMGPRTRIVAEQKQSMAHSILVASMPDSDHGESNRGASWGLAMCDAVIKAVGARGYNLMLIHPDRATPQDIERLISGRPSGVVLPEIAGHGQEQPKWSQILQRVGIPMAVYGGNPELAGFDRVTSDHATGSYELTRLLLDRGCRRILMLFAADPDIYWVRGRRAGYERALAEAHLEPLPMVCYTGSGIAQSGEPADTLDLARRRAASYLLEHVGPTAGDQRVDAIMTASDGETFAVAGACRLLGAVPGKDVQIVGYDNYWRQAVERSLESATPLATVDKHNAAIGRELVNLLLDRIEGRLPEEKQTRVVLPQLLVTDTPL